MVDRNKIIHIVDVICDYFIPFRDSTLIGQKPSRDNIAHMCGTLNHVKLFAKTGFKRKNQPTYLVFIVLSLGNISTEIPKRIQNMVDLKRGEVNINLLPAESMHFMIIGERELIEKYKMVKKIDELNNRSPYISYRLYSENVFMTNIPACAATPKFALLDNEEVERTLVLANLSKQELQSVTDKDPTVIWAGGHVKECMMYERYSPNVGTIYVIRRIVDTPSAVKEAGDVDDKDDDE